MRSWRPPYPIYDQNYSKAIKYYEKSASFGNPQALKNLGNLYFFGKGVKQNLNKARGYFDKAVQGNSDVFDFNEIDLIKTLIKRLNAMKRKITQTKMQIIIFLIQIKVVLIQMKIVPLRIKIALM